MKIWCCGCQVKVDARLTNGKEIYPHRSDLFKLPFWKCDECGNYVGCHHKTKNRTNPLGCIPTPEIKKARSHIHAILDPLWKNKRFERSEVYRMIEQKLDLKWKYHTAQIRTIEEAREIYKAVREIANAA